MSIALDTRFALGTESDLTTPTSTQNYNYGLGDIVSVYNTSYKAIQRYMYVKAHTGLTAYQPYVINYGSTSGAEVVTAAPATLAAPGSLVCVPQVAFTSGYYGFVLIEGDGKALLKAETYAIGDFLQVLNGGTYLVVDGTSGATVRLVNSCGISKEAGSTNVARNVYLFGKVAVVAAT